MNFRHVELFVNFCSLLASEADIDNSDASVCVDAEVEDSPCLFSVTTDES